MKLYTKEHEWIEISGDTARFGITEYAVEQLGDITFIDLPETGASFKQNEVCCTIESVKAASDIYMPLSGEITEVNEELEDEPEKINESPLDEGWIGEIKLSQPDEKDRLLSEDQYKALIQEID